MEYSTCRRPLLGLLDSGHSALLATFLFGIRIPFLLLVIGFERLRSHEIGFRHDVDIDSDMLAHETHTKSVRKTANPEGVSTPRTRFKYKIVLLLKEEVQTYPSIISVSRITAASSESLSPRWDRSLMFALPMMARRSS